MKGCISVINSGSSSIKFSLYSDVEEEELSLLFQGQIEGIGSAPKFIAKDGFSKVVDELSWENTSECRHDMLLSFIIDWLRAKRLKLGLVLIGVGHRVVHGGEVFSAPVRVDEEVLQILESFVPLAPLHQPHNLRSIRSVMKLGPDIPQVACFDTAFHRTVPSVDQQFALPRELGDEGIRRYGFHGLSYEYIARRLRTLEPECATGRVIVAHLGSGASMCAIHDGMSISSTMGFSALDGLVMGTRPGNLDPGVVLYLIQQKGYQPEELNDLLYKKSGLFGISGISNDMRVLLKNDNPQAEEAVDLFLHRIKRELGGLVAILGGVDALVFTAGIGEHSAPVRRRICEDAEWLGLKLDYGANDAGKLKISTADSPVSAWVVPTNEELMIATHTRDTLR